MTPLLDSRGFETRTVTCLDTARSCLLEECFAAAIVQLGELGDLQSTIDTLEEIAVRAPHVEFVILSSRPIDSFRTRAFTQLPYPPRTQDVLDAVQNGGRCERRSANGRRNAARSAAGSPSPGVIVGKSTAMQRMFEALRRVAPTKANVLLTGETGTGKELVARAIHGLYRTNGEPFIIVHCSGLPPSLLESELFGHVRGSFTGAVKNRRGPFEAAHHGTLFLDEVATIGLESQVKLLRVLQDRAVQRVGTNDVIETDFRLISATNRDLPAEVGAGRFREDLYYRLNVVPIAIPPLRERREDIPALAEHFRCRFARMHRVEAPELTQDTLLRMMEYDWPGNVRELENFMERAVIMGHYTQPIRFHLPAAPNPVPPARGVTDEALEQRWTLAHLEREHILNVLHEVHGHHTNAAAVLGISRRTLSRKLKKYRAAPSPSHR